MEEIISVDVGFFTKNFTQINNNNSQLQIACW